MNQSVVDIAEERTSVTTSWSREKENGTFVVRYYVFAQRFLNYATPSSTVYIYKTIAMFRCVENRKLEMNEWQIATTSNKETKVRRQARYASSGMISRRYQSKIRFQAL